MEIQDEITNFSLFETKDVLAETKEVPPMPSRQTLEPTPAETKEAPPEAKKNTSEEESLCSLEEAKNMLIIAYTQGAQLHNLFVYSMSDICNCLISDDTTDDEKVKELRKLVLKQHTTENYKGTNKLPHEFLHPAQIFHLRENIEETTMLVLQYAKEVGDFGSKMREITKILCSDDSSEKKVEKVSDAVM